MVSGMLSIKMRPIKRARFLGSKEFTVCAVSDLVGDYRTSRHLSVTYRPSIIKRPPKVWHPNFGSLVVGIQPLESKRGRGEMRCGCTVILKASPCCQLLITRISLHHHSRGLRFTTFAILFSIFTFIAKFIIFLVFVFWPSCSPIHRFHL